MSDAPFYFLEITQESPSLLNDVPGDAVDASRMIARLQEFRARINHAMEQVHGEEWDEEYPDILEMCSKMTKRLQALEKMKQSMKSLNTPAQPRTWRVIRIKEVHAFRGSLSFLSVRASVRNAVQNDASQKVLYDALERFLVYIDTVKPWEMVHKEDVAYWNEVETLKPEAQRLLANPQKDQWDDFLRRYIPE